MCELPVSTNMQTATMLRALAHNAGTNVGDHDLIIPVALARDLPPAVLSALYTAQDAHRKAYIANLRAYQAAINHAGNDYDPAKDAHDAAHYETRRSAELDREITADLDKARASAMNDAAVHAMTPTANHLQAKVYAGTFPQKGGN